jgi:hypothetical protein
MVDEGESGVRSIYYIFILLSSSLSKLNNRDPAMISLPSGAVGSLLKVQAVRGDHHFPTAYLDFFHIYRKYIFFL